MILIISNYKPDKDNPNIDKETPEVIFKAQRILQPKYGNIFEDENGIQKQDRLNNSCIFANNIEMTIQFWKWNIEVENYFWNLNKNDQCNNTPAD